MCLKGEKVPVCGDRARGVACQRGKAPLLAQVGRQKDGHQIETTAPYGSQGLRQIAVSLEQSSHGHVVPISPARRNRSQPVVETAYEQRRIRLVLESGEGGLQD